MKVYQRISSSTMICFMALAGSGMATSTFGQEIKIVPTRAGDGAGGAARWDDPINAVFNSDLECWEYTSDTGDFQVQLNLIGEGWGEFQIFDAGENSDEPRDARLGAIQVTVVATDANGYNNGLGGVLVPEGWPGGGHPETRGDGAYIPKTHCLPAFGGDGRPCVAPFSLTCVVGGGVCGRNPNYIMTAAEVDFPAVAFPTIDYAWATAADFGSAVDPGVEKVIGTLVLNVPADAAGTYRIALNTGQDFSFMTSDTGAPVDGVMFTNACITIITGSCCTNLDPGSSTCADNQTSTTCALLPNQPSVFRAGVACAEEACCSCLTDADCDDGDGCTDDICDGCSCRNQLNYDPAVDCCNPADGGTTQIDDGEVCTDDSCDSDTGSVAHDCNTGSCTDGNDCTVDDVCDGTCDDGVGSPTDPSGSPAKDRWCGGTDVNSLECSSTADCPVGVCDCSNGFCSLCAHPVVTTRPCCFANGTCGFESESCCVQQGGQPVFECQGDPDFDGIDEACLGGCCLPDLSCTELLPIDCANASGLPALECRGDLDPMNGIDDACEADCDGDGVPDFEVIANCPNGDLSCDDCNLNSIPDECDFAEETSTDNNKNGIPDDCEPQACCFNSQGFSVCQNLSSSVCETLENGVVQGLDTACPTENIFTAGHGSGPFTHLTDPAKQCPEGGGRGADCIDGDPIDPWSTAVDAEMCHLFSVPGSPAIPADFFGPGSDPFTGQVCLEGKPLGPTPFGDFGAADTLVRRTGGPAGTGDPFDRCELPLGDEATVNAEVVALSLQSVAPIIVTFNGGQNPESWDVMVDLSEVTPPPGSITATKTHCIGGTYNSELHVQPRFTFTKVADPNNSEVLDTGLAGIEFLTLTQDTDSPWTSDVSEILGLSSPICTDFHPSIEDTAQTTNCDCNGNGVRDVCDIEDRTSEDCNDNGIPDECSPDVDADADGDGVIDDCDNCPSIPNPNQADADGDLIGDLCDACPNDPQNDADGDGVCGPVDNCPDVFNPDQADSDSDGLGDACDPCPQIPVIDCGCESLSDCGDGFFCNGQETCEQGICMSGTNPCAPSEVCDEVEDECVAPPIPAVSEWGLVILALLLLAGGKVYFNRRRPATR